jgi:hypothetical protein
MFAHPALQTTVLVAIGVLALALRLPGQSVSLWLDEAWVAASVLSPGLAEMLHYPTWLQTSPPLFLLLVRAAVSVFGINNEAFRLVPLLGAIWAGAMTFLLLREFFPGRRYWVMPFAWATVVLTPPGVEFAQQCKQYSTDMAAAATLLYLGLRYHRRPTGSNALVLLGAMVIGPWLAFPAVLLLPGLLWLVVPNWRRCAAMAAACGISVAALYFWQIEPNTAPSLFQHWSVGTEGAPLAARAERQLRLLGLLFQSDSAAARHPALALAPFLPLLGGFALGRRRVNLVLALFWIPIAVASAADLLGRYPVFPSTSLFLLPSFGLAFSAAASALATRFRGGARRWIAPALFALVLTYSYRAYGMRPPQSLGQVREQAEEAVRYLYSRVQADDGIYVHASMAEALRVYTRALGWEAAPLRWGQTSWPCCPRALPFPRGETNAAKVDADLARLFPRPMPARVWTIFTNRQEHWEWVAMDDRPVIRRFLAERGCTSRPTSRFENVGLELFVCEAQK